MTSFNVEIAGKSADRFRAYTAAKLLRSPVAADHIKRAEAKLPPLEPGAKIRYDGEEVAIEGEVKGAALTVKPDIGVMITKVVFYSGPVEAESVVGSVAVNLTGEIDIVVVGQVAPEKAAAMIVDE